MHNSAMSYTNSVPCLMAATPPQLVPSLHAHSATSIPTTCSCITTSSSFSALPASTHDVGSRRNRCACSTTWSCRNTYGRILVIRRKFEPQDSTREKSRRSCGCRELKGARASSHLNFQLPSRSFASSTTLSFEPSDLGCKSASYNNSQFSGEKGGGKQPQQQQEKDSGASFGLYLHDLMDQAGIETTHARAARMGFAEEVAKLGKETSVSAKNEGLDTVNMARAALEISAEDDALVSHSSVPLPVDSYLERLDSMATEFAGHHLPAHSREVFESLGNYLWTYKGFRSTKARTSQDARDFYLNGVLTRRQGPPLMLGLIYSEVVKRLWRLGTIDFLVDMDIPVDGLSFPLPIYKSPDGTSVPSMDDGNNTRLFTPKNVLSEILRFLKRLYWPWRSLPGSGEGSDFLEAATAASRGIVTSASSSHGPFESLFNAPSSERGSEVARARAAQYRLQRGIWTSTTFGDLRRALAASERLVILGGDKCEHRDYGMLLFHAGLYEQAFQYLSSYASMEVPKPVPAAFNALKAQVEAKEAVALNKLLERLRLIMTERSWNTSPDPPPPIESPPDPW